MTVFGQGTALVWIWRIGSIIFGGSAGYAFYKIVGCKSGSCPITGNPWLSTLYGALLGALLVFR
jgi:hypothetical protein